MRNENTDKKSRIVSAAIIGMGMSLWLASGVALFTHYGWQDQLITLAIVPVVVVMGLFPNTFPLPAGLKLTQEKMTFTLSDAVVLVVACWHGGAAAIFVAGIEGFTSSRRTVRRFSSNFYSSGMMSLAAGAATVSLNVVLRYGFGEVGLSREHSISAIAVALLVASLVHTLVNSGIISLLFAVRLGSSVWANWRSNLLFAAPMLLPTSAAASLMYIALQHDALTMIVIGAPVLIAIHFGHRQHRDSIQDRIDVVERAQLERISLMEKSHRETIEALAVAINAKDKVTHEHVLRVQIYAAGVARLLGCTDAEIEALRAGALLHDIGKIAVPDYILTKPGKLTAAEFEKMKLHTLVGAQVLGRVEFPYPVVPVVRHHHERWDGKGYPDGLAGEDIPLTARIISVVDCFDAVREDRQYRRGMTRQEAVDYIMSGSGTQYDPHVVGTFITHLPEFEAEILAMRNQPLPTFGIEPPEELSEIARLIAPAAGLSQPVSGEEHQQDNFSDEELGALYELTQAVAGVREPEQMLSEFTDKLKLLVPYNTCAVTTLLPMGGDYVVACAAGEHARFLEGRPVTPGEGVTGWVVANRKPFFNTDPRLDLPILPLELETSYKTLAAYPVVNNTLLHGVVTLYSSALTEYSPHHQRLLGEAVAILAAELARVCTTAVN
ncbi:MAG: HD domain-containing phosphohydrolase [Pyrinomonadaceae bacterium]